MLQFNELSIDPAGRRLIVDVQVQNLAYYQDVGIDSIIIDTQKTFNSAGPSSTPFFEKDCCKEKHVRIAVDIDSLGDNIFFVYAIADENYSCDTPCGMKETIILGVVYNKFTFYKYAMGLLGEIDGCEPPQWLIDHILKINAFEMCIKAGNYTKAIEYWDWFFSKKVRRKVGCGCHGKAKFHSL